MSEILKEFVENVLLEKARGSFSLNEFKKLNDVDKMYDYCKDHDLTVLGTGSSRIVFAMSSSRVLKLAHFQRPHMGCAQNEAEVDLFTDPRTKPIVAKIYEYGPSYTWLISELAKPMKPTSKEFNKKFRIPLWELTLAARDVAKGSSVKLDGKYLIKPDTMVYVDAIAGLIQQGVEPGDIEREEQWGTTAEGRIVLLDYGLTVAVYDKHYSRGW
jgi:hypothetical protein